MAVEEVEYEEVAAPPKTGFEKLPKNIQESIAKISGQAKELKSDNYVLTYLLFGAAGGAFAFYRNRKVLHGIGLGLVAAYLYTTFIDNKKTEQK
jgi:hypothetical protein